MARTGLAMVIAAFVVSCGGSAEEDASGGSGGSGGSGNGGAGGASGAGASTGGGGSSGSSGSGGGSGSSGSGGGSGSSGSGGSGGTSGTGASAGTGGTGGTGECPEDRPTEGGPCAPEGLRCQYGGVCSYDWVRCEGGQWWAEPAPGPPQPTCEVFAGSPPKQGDDCLCLGNLQNCRYYECDGRGVVSASCNGTTWEVETSPCETTLCGPQGSQGGLECAADELCVATVGGPGIFHQCEPNPCAQQAMEDSCDCAGHVCGGPPYTCASVEDKTLTCACPTCP